MHKIEKSIFENATVIENITDDYINSLREFSVIYGTYKYNTCYIVTNVYYEAFSKENTWLQTMITLTYDSDGNSSIDHIKSRYLKPLSTTGDAVWTRWQIEDASTYNYLNGYLRESNKTIFREWEGDSYTESDIDFIINTLEDETQINLINFAEHQNELFLVPDNSIQLYAVEMLPTPAIDYLNMYFVPKQETVIGTHTFQKQAIYVCLENAGSDSETYPYMWEYALIYGVGSQSYAYDVVGEVSDIPGVSGS